MSKISKVRYNHLPGLNVEYMRIFPESLASVIFFMLERQIEYLENQKICVFGNYFDIPRKHAAFGDPGLSYTFSNLTLRAKPWTPLLVALRDCVTSVTGQQYNFVLINRYADGKDSIGFHCDDEKELEPSSSVACLSFGAERPFTFRNKGFVNLQSFTLRLKNGTLLLMHPPTNRYFLHGLPRRPHIAIPRISLTFRNIVS